MIVESNVNNKLRLKSTGLRNMEGTKHMYHRTAVCTIYDILHPLRFVHAACRALQTV